MPKKKESEITKLNIPATSGVYILKNLTTGKEYIGCTGNLLQRAKKHFCDLHCNRYRIQILQDDYSRGHKFTFIVLFSTNRIYAYIKELRYLETWYILDEKTIENGYNSVLVSDKETNAHTRALSPIEFQKLIAN